MPSWKKVIVSGSDASLNSINVATNVVAQSFTGSLFGTASFAVSASQAQNATTASYVLNAVSASFATSASFVTASNVFGPFGSNSVISASFATFAQTASYALNGGVTQILAGPNITVSPLSGRGQVTISSTGTGSGNFNTSTGSYGSFYDTTTQINPVANAANSMSFNETAITNGVSLSGSISPFNTYIKTENAGVYNIQFSAQIDKTDGGEDNIDIWIRKNGIDLIDTATSLTLPKNNNRLVAAWNWFVQSAANDYYQIIWSSADIDMRLLAEASSSAHPGIPSVILTANRIDQFLSNTGSFNGTFTGQFTGSLFGTASFAISSSQAQTANTASYVLNAVSASFATSASHAQNATTASYAINALSASFATSASQAQNTTTASYALTSSNVQGGEQYYIPLWNTDTSLTSSYLYQNNDTLKTFSNFGVNKGLTLSFLNDQYFLGNAVNATGSFVVVNSSNGVITIKSNNYTVVEDKLGVGMSPTNRGLAVSGSIEVTHGITGSLHGTASFVTSSNVFGPFGSNSVISASYAVSASHVIGGVDPFPYTGSAKITGSLGVTGSVAATTVQSNVFINSQTITDTLYITSGSNALIIGPVGISSSITVGTGSNLYITDFTNPTPNLQEVTDVGSTTTNSITAANFITTSDRRLKSDIKQIENPFEVLGNIKSYEYVKDGKKDAGFIAQEVQETIPYSVFENEEGMLTMSDRPLLAYLYAAVMELKKENKQLKKELKSIKP